jgi:hypothetical protein
MSKLVTDNVRRMRKKIKGGICACGGDLNLDETKKLWNPNYVRFIFNCSKCGVMPCPALPWAYIENEKESEQITWINKMAEAESLYIYLQLNRVTLLKVATKQPTQGIKEDIYG